MMPREKKPTSRSRNGKVRRFGMLGARWIGNKGTEDTATAVSFLLFW